jgi:hypothetical protein
MPDLPLVTETERRFTAGLTLLCERDLDARRGTVRRIRDLFRGLAREVAPDGDLSIAQRLLLQRTCVLSALLSHHEACLLLGREALPIGDYLAMSTSLRRLLSALTDHRMKHQLKDVVDPLTYAAARDQEAAS